MGRQVGFFALPEDLAPVMRSAADAGYRAVDEIVRGPPQARSPLEAQPTVHGRFFLVPPEIDVADLKYDAPVDEPGTRALTWWKEPVIEVIVSLRDGTSLKNGRIYLPTSGSYTPLEERLERRSPSLPKVYARMARLMGKWTRADRFRFRVGPAAAEDAKSGRLELRHAGYRLLPL